MPFTRLIVNAHVYAAFDSAVYPRTVSSPIAAAESQRSASSDPYTPAAVADVDAVAGAGAVRILTGKLHIITAVKYRRDGMEWREEFATAERLFDEAVSGRARV
jgi:hypothetical protein